LLMNRQREIIYSQRRMVLEGQNIKDNIIAMVDDVINACIEAHISEDRHREEWDLKSLLRYLEDVFLPKGALTVEQLDKMSKEEIKGKLIDKAHKLYEEKEKDIGSEQMREVERVVLLRSVDLKWMDHIDAMEQLKQGMGLRAYRQRDPVQEYQIEGMNMFDEMIFHIKEETVKFLYRIKAERKIQRERVANPTSTNYDDSTKRQPIRKEKKIGRNDPCPCGSGKKYKNCCGKNL
jgi:preprotein translocase subunit SecA